MGKRALVRVSALFFALVVLILSVAETASVKYAFGAREPETTPRPIDVEYALPYPGSINPGSPLWPVKALRDKVSLTLSGDLVSQAEMELLFADKRLASGWTLWARGETNEALVTFSKAEGYFIQSFYTLGQVEDQDEVRDTMRQITYASLKHREVLERVLVECGDEARPMVTKLLDTSKFLYTAGSDRMEELGMNPPSNPF